MDPVRDAIHDKIAGTAAVTSLLSSATAVFHQQAPRDTAPPYVLFSKQSGTRVHVFDGPAVRPLVWQVKAVDKGPSASRAEDIDAQLEAALHDAALSITGQSLLYLRRASDVQYPERDGAEIFNHVGGLYRVTTQPTT